MVPLTLFNFKDSLNFFDQTFLNLGQGILFPVRESLENDIPAEDRNTAQPFFTVCGFVI
jgi:hypothetical protein